MTNHLLHRNSARINRESVNSKWFPRQLTSPFLREHIKLHDNTK